VERGGHRIKGLDVLFLEVNNLEESLAFYTEKLGFEIDSNDPGSEPPLATLRVGSLGITLAQNLNTMLRRGRGVSFILEVDDVDGYYDDLKESGVEVKPPVDEGWSGRFITVQDPDQYRFFFVTRSRGVDR
jgi:catechol 2,3-dioxygenase-like lactoylglutathione lyase family enzyme